MNLKLILISCLGLLSNPMCYAQPGCTDPYATNYNPGATSNDGSCVYAVTHDTMQLRAQLPAALTESSGLAWDNGKLWSHNDSSNPASFFSIDTNDGHIIQKVNITNHSNIDWEDIAADDNYIYIGDFGNNNGDRTDLRILKVAKSAITGDTANVTAQVISFSYADQASHASNPLNNYDCEALISIGDSLYIFTKDRGDLQTRVYKMPKTPGSYVLSPYTSFNVNGAITGASYNAATHEIVLIGYTLLKTYSFLWFLNDYQGDMFFSGNKRRIEIGGNSEWQTEGIEFISSDRFFVSNETATVPASLFIGHKNWLSAVSVPDVQSGLKYSVFPNPAGKTITIAELGGKNSYRVMNMGGKEVLSGTADPKHNTIGLDKLKTGIYLLELADDKGGKFIQRITKD
ncbi:MAG: T9SS type A sorting domain-containing protein [Bacteroidetes bacterium]|nr:T9SS type A sorting domain-containing protein [Bacteroidota bacterium]